MTHWLALWLILCAVLCLLAVLRPYWLLRIFYGPMLAAVLAVSLPFWLWKLMRAGKYREGLGERLGMVPERVRRTLDQRPLIWVHAVSVGEVIAVSRLLGDLGSEMPDHRLVLSTTTRTGQTLARNRFGAENVFYFPLDFGWTVRRYLNVLRPRLLVLVETEFWPNVLWQARRRGIQVAVVNARISDRSLPRYMKLKDLWRRVLKGISLVLAQSELDAERLRAIGIESGRVQVAGNLKFDVRAPQASVLTEAFREQLPRSARLLVAGSTLEGEEARILAAWPEIVQAVPDAVLLLAPRHPERFAAVAALLDAGAVPWVRRSDWMERPAPIAAGSVFLLDSIGELASVYALASLAFVGGSLVDAGGHNPLEPAQFGVPVIMGPSYENFRGIVDALRAGEAIEIVTAKTLAPVTGQLLADMEQAQALGARGREVFERESGATARTVKALRELLGASMVSA